MNAVNKVKSNIDWSIVVSTVVASVVVGASVYGLRQMGAGKVASVVKGG